MSAYGNMLRGTICMPVWHGRHIHPHRNPCKPDQIGERPMNVLVRETEVTGAGSGSPSGSSGSAHDGVPVEVDYYIVPGNGGHGRARADALLPVIRAFACRVAVFGYNATRNDKFLVMAAIRPALDALEILLPGIAIQMEQAARAATGRYAGQVGDALRQMNTKAQRRVLITPFFRDYLRGFGLGVTEQIQAVRAETLEAGGRELAQIMAADQARIADVFNRDFPGRPPLRPESTGHHGGMEAGRKAGRAAELGDDGYLAKHDLIFAML
jgi:hypothetical protein